MRMGEDRHHCCSDHRLPPGIRGPGRSCRRLGRQFRTHRRLGRSGMRDKVSHVTGPQTCSLKKELEYTHLITHGEATIIRCWTPHIGDEGDVEEVYEVEPAVEDEPAGGPVGRDEVLLAGTGESPAVDEEEHEDDQDAGENAPPKLAVHGGLDGLAALREVLHGSTQGVESPDIEGGQRGSEGQNDKQDKWAGVFRRNGEGDNGVDEAEDEVGDGESAHIDHSAAEAGPHDAIAHADNEEQEEGEGVARGRQHRHEAQQGFGPRSQAVTILVVVEEPGDEHLEHKEGEDGGDVMLHRQHVVAVAVVQRGPGEGK